MVQEHTENSVSRVGNAPVDALPDADAIGDVNGHLQEGLVPDDLELSSLTTNIRNDSLLSEAVTPAVSSSPDTVSMRSLKKKVVAESAKTFSDWGFGEQAALLSGIRDFLATVPDNQLRTFVERALRPVTEWGYRDRDPVARGICRVATPMLLEAGSTIEGVENLAITRDRPAIFLGNHLAGVDVHALDVLLARSGYQDVADNLTAVVGHKSFEYPFLRHVSLAFGTLQVPQSMSVSTRSVLMGAREMASGARKVINAAHERLVDGQHLVVFPEGTRSRTGEMYSLLPAIARYIRGADAVIIPFAHSGTEDILPPDTFTCSKATVHYRIGKPVEADKLVELTKGAGRQATTMNTIGYMISALLPEGYQGHYRHSEVPKELTRTHDIASRLV